MIIQNFEELATTGRRRDCLGILEAGLRAAAPENVIPRYVTPEGIAVNGRTVSISDYSDVYSVAFGKAGDSMTRALNAIIPVRSGIIVIPKGSRSVIRGKKFQIFNSAHPKPDQTSVRAAREVAKFVQNRKRGELVVFLVSGGGSSLLAMPDGITLDDKVYVTDLLLRSGASIQEFNCVRKHLSGIKGGRLVEKMRCQGAGLVMSDVGGDDLSSIASGTTYMDDTTFSDALDILEKYGLRRRVPAEVLQVLEEGHSETPKEPVIENQIIASNADCLAAMESEAKRRGYDVRTMQVFGDIKDAVRRIVGNISDGRKTCLLIGGETTVKVLGKGAGGRNQEMVLRLLKNTQGSGRMTIASMGTDGIDGNTVFAGAITENTGTDTETIKEFLRNSDSGRFFQKRRGSIMTGFTHTNLMDIGAILR